MTAAADACTSKCMSKRQDNKKAGTCGGDNAFELFQVEGEITFADINTPTVEEPQEVCQRGDRRCNERERDRDSQRPGRDDDEDELSSTYLTATVSAIALASVIA